MTWQLPMRSGDSGAAMESVSTELVKIDCGVYSAEFQKYLIEKKIFSGRPFSMVSSNYF